MATRADRERLQHVNEKHKNSLAILLSREENKYCADCLSKGPRWASWNLGVLLCIRCSGLHRSLGVHISRVKSVNLDTWTKEQMLCFCSRGNGWAKDMYEAKLPRDFKRPKNDSSLEYFIRDKYEKKKYKAPVEISLRPLTGLGLLEETTDSPKKDRKSRGREGVSIISIPKPRGLRPASPGIPRPKSLPQLPKHNDDSPVQMRAHNHVPGPTTDDLLGLSSPISKDAPVSVTLNTDSPSASSDLTEDLFGPMSSFQSLTMTASVSSPNLLNGGTESSSILQEPPATTEKVEDKRLSKDSILSLYSQSHGTSPSSMMPPGNFNISSQPNMGYQQQVQQQQPQMQYNQQQFPNMGMQGMPGGYQVNQQQQQQQMMAMQQQQQHLQMQQMAQHMSGMNMGGMVGYNGLPSQQQNTMQNNMGLGMGYSAQPQAGVQQIFQPQQQQMYAGVRANGANPGVPQMGAYGAMSGGMMPGMQTQQPANGSMWRPGAATGVNSGHTLSTQLWK